MATPNLDPIAVVPPQEVVNELPIPPLTGGVLSLVLCGMCIPRLFDYYAYFSQDRRRNKVALSIFGLGTIIYAVLQVVHVIRTGSTNLHTIASLFASDSSTALLPIVYTVVSLPTQLILAERARKLNGNSRLLAAWLGLMIAVSLGASILSVVYNFRAQENISFLDSPLDVTIPASFTVYLITDLTIVIGILVGLRKSSKAFLASPQEGLGFGGARLIRAAWQTSVESAVLPTVLNITTLVLHSARSTGLLFVIPSFMIPPVYSLTLLFSLERRRAHNDAARFRSILAGSSSLPVAHAPTASIAPPVRYSTHHIRSIGDSIEVKLSGDGVSQYTKRPGIVAPAEALDPNQTCSLEMKFLVT